MRMPAVKLSAFWICAAVVVLVGIALTIFDVVAINKFIYFAGYVVLQYVVLATAWNIMGGYMGYVNFGTAGFFAVGAYQEMLGGVRGSKHCVLPEATEILIDRNGEGDLVCDVLPGHTTEDVLHNLGYGRPGRKNPPRTAAPMPLG